MTKEQNINNLMREWKKFKELPEGKKSSMELRIYNDKLAPTISNFESTTRSRNALKILMKWFCKLIDD